MFTSRVDVERHSVSQRISSATEYKGIRLECGYRVDILVGGVVAVEVKSVQALAPIHDLPLLTYLRLGGWRVGLLINFNVVVLKDGIHRKIMGFDN
jgi:GxxExxY protein